MRLTAPFFALLVAGACGGPQSVGEAGAECFRDDECAFGLVCTVPQGGEGRVCTRDVSGLVTEVDVPVAGSAAGGASAGGTMAGGTSPGGTMAGMNSAGMNSAGTSAGAPEVPGDAGAGGS